VHAAAPAAACAFLALLAVACPAGGSDDDDDDVAGLGEPCTSGGTPDDLCLGDLVCVEAIAGAGGRCEPTPTSCASAADDFCGCDLDELCDNGVVPRCYVLEGRRGVICE